MKTFFFALALVGVTVRLEPADERLRRRGDGGPCCRITIIDPRTRTVTAVDRTRGGAFQFKVPEQALSALRVGQPISANYDTNLVVLDGLGDLALVAAVIPRFEARCGGDCVKDRWTGYLWQSTPNPMAHSRSQARNVCSSFNSIHPPDGLTTDGDARDRGWSMPYIWELSTLPDPTLPAPAVPPNLFFVQPGTYWGLGTTGDDRDIARVFGTPFGGVGTVKGGSVNLMVWCVLSHWTTGTVILNP